MRREVMGKVVIFASLEVKLRINLFCVARDFFRDSTVNTKLASTAALLIQM